MVETGLVRGRHPLLDNVVHESSLVRSWLSRSCEHGAKQLEGRGKAGRVTELNQCWAVCKVWKGSTLGSVGGVVVLV